MRCWHERTLRGWHRKQIHEVSESLPGPDPVFETGTVQAAGPIHPSSPQARRARPRRYESRSHRPPLLRVRADGEVCRRTCLGKKVSVGRLGVLEDDGRHQPNGVRPGARGRTRLSS
jgi:hypothetical protein